MTPVSIERNLTALDEALKVLEHSPASPETQLVREHIQTARSYLLGAMDAEYSINMELTRQAVQEMPTGESRSRLQDLLSDLD
jgi:hypothetical protein